MFLWRNDGWTVECLQVYEKIRRIQTTYRGFGIMGKKGGLNINFQLKKTFILGPPTPGEEEAPF